jgi:two-component sensor histidine kinase
MRVIAEMNHHIRNALQVIQFSTRNQSGEAEVKAMRDAVQRITWALREVLPQLMNAEDSRLAWEIKDPEQTEVYRRPPAV